MVPDAEAVSTATTPASVPRYASTNDATVKSGRAAAYRKNEATTPHQRRPVAERPRLSGSPRVMTLEVRMVVDMTLTSPLVSITAMHYWMSSAPSIRGNSPFTRGSVHVAIDVALLIVSFVLMARLPKDTHAETLRLEDVGERGGLVNYDHRRTHFHIGSREH
jgi:hypothetical protein